MTKEIEIAIIAICAVYAVITVFDFSVYTIKSAPKSSSLTKTTWKIGAVCIVALVYWYLNGQKFV